MDNPDLNEPLNAGGDDQLDNPNMEKKEVLENDIDDAKEQKELGAYPPFRTLCKLTIGPLCSQLVNALYGLMNSFWISKSKHGEAGMTVMSIIIVVDFIHIAIGQYFNICLSERISYLFGIRQPEHCAQVVVDMIRYVLIAGIIVPAILIPCARPLCRWYGADDMICDMCMNYLIPQLCCAFINYAYLGLCGLLQAMGKTVMYGVCQITSCVLTMCVFDPLFLIALKTDMWGAAVANTLACLIPFVYIFVMVFCGKYTVKPKFNMFFKKFNPHSWTALKVSFSQLISNFAAEIPVLMLGKYVALSGEAVGEYVPVMAAWNLVDRLYEIVICVCNALNQGFLPAGSYAFGSNRLHRLMKLVLYAFGIGTAWSALMCLILCVFPRQLASLYGKDERFLHYAEKTMIYSFCTTFINMGQFTIVVCLVATKMVTLSIITSCLTLLVPIPLFSTIFYFTDKANPIRLHLSFVARDVWAFIIVWSVAIWKLRFLLTVDQSEMGADGEMESIEQKDDVDDGKMTQQPVFMFRRHYSNITPAMNVVVSRSEVINKEKQEKDFRRHFSSVTPAMKNSVPSAKKGTVNKDRRHFSSITPKTAQPPTEL
ncbi:MatE family protein [Tritrichomonas foetus]|uniref:MatE family protein n=1 Tax=Tritrichomonas foetus TaxID=1144522 RepID=A0A1J4L469_9EUKA|nr:MatE family protein [Tritrichomonas foetus]|eukprot:OHT16772.1 MatE family protein [Tritrichomonas foetus]